MKVDRHCPRCRSHVYHWVLTPKVAPGDLAHLQLHHWPPEAIPRRVMICCAHCAHEWNGRLTRLERGFDD